MKDLFTGSLGRLNNHGGSRIYTTPNTIYVPPEYEIEIGEHGDFVTCSLDGRLWLFKDKLVVLKWNATIEKMEYATSKSIDEENLILYGIDWILTDKNAIFAIDESPYVSSQKHNVSNLQPMEKFYSFLPPYQDNWQILNGYLMQRPGNTAEKALYPLNMPEVLYLIYYKFEEYNIEYFLGKTSNYFGMVDISQNDDGDYSLEFSYGGEFEDVSDAGLAIVQGDIVFFRISTTINSFLPVSSDLQIFNGVNWQPLMEGEGNIFFDPFNYTALALSTTGITIVDSDINTNIKSLSCNGLAQWIAPTKNICYIDGNIVISSINNGILTTYINAGLYRHFLSQKTLALTVKTYNSNKLSLGLENSSKISVNELKSASEIEINFEINLINVFEHDYYNRALYGSYEMINGEMVSNGIYYTANTPIRRLISPILLHSKKPDVYYRLLNKIYVYYRWSKDGDVVEGPDGYVEIAGNYPAGVKTFDEWLELRDTLASKTTYYKGLTGSADVNAYESWDNRNRYYYQFDTDHIDYSYFSISLDTGNFTNNECTVDVYYTIGKRYQDDDEIIFKTHYNEVYLGTCLNDNINKIYIVGGSTKEDDFSKLKVVNTFEVNWKILQQISDSEYFSELKLKRIVMIWPTNDHITASVLNENAEIITMKNFYFTSEQKELLKIYNRVEGAYSYYNIYDEKKFAHLVVFTNEEQTKGIFFVFHTTIL